MLYFESPAVVAHNGDHDISFIMQAVRRRRLQVDGVYTMQLRNNDSGV